MGGEAQAKGIEEDEWMGDGEWNRPTLDASLDEEKDPI